MTQLTDNRFLLPLSTQRLGHEEGRMESNASEIEEAMGKVKKLQKGLQVRLSCDRPTTNAVVVEWGR